MATSVLTVSSAVDKLKAANPSYAAALDQCMHAVGQTIKAGNSALKAQRQAANSNPSPAIFNAAFKNALPVEMQAYYDLLFQIYPDGTTEPGLVEIVASVFGDAVSSGKITYDMRHAAIAAAKGTKI